MVIRAGAGGKKRNTHARGRNAIFPLASRRRQFRAEASAAKIVRRNDRALSPDRRAAARRDADRARFLRSFRRAVHALPVSRFVERIIARRRGAGLLVFAGG